MRSLTYGSGVRTDFASMEIPTVSGYGLRGPDFLGGLLVGEGGSQRAGILTYRQNEIGRASCRERV